MGTYLRNIGNYLGASGYSIIYSNDSRSLTRETCLFPRKVVSLIGDAPVTMVIRKFKYIKYIKSIIYLVITQ